MFTVRIGVRKASHVFQKLFVWVKGGEASSLPFKAVRSNSTVASKVYLQKIGHKRV